MNMHLSKLQEIVKDTEAWQGHSPQGHKDWDTIQQLNK